MFIKLKIASVIISSVLIVACSNHSNHFSQNNIKYETDSINQYKL